MLLLDLILVFEALAFLVSLSLYFRKNVYPYLRYFPIFLFITVVVEVIGFTLKEKGVNSWPMYNFFYVFEFVFYFFVLSLIIQNSLLKKIILFASILYSAATIINILSQDIYVFQSLTYNIGALMVACFSAYYIYEIFKAPLMKNLFKDPSFWISIGLLTYYSCTVPLYVIIDYLNSNVEPERSVYSLILTIANVILYSSFTMAIFCFLRFHRTPITQ